ncbi:MAG TPA: helix-turn-helix transcriptional regulator [Polyangiaceae bacterium]|nr:helix-turn-helix transcriptional regulator [Polyangiaceae bacterium]
MSRAAGRAPLRVLVAPLPIATVRVARDTPVAAAFLQDPEGVRIHAVRVLGQTHGLTPAEQRVAELIVAGCKLPEAARRLGVSLHTVRTHAARIRHKTGTRTQAALVAMIAGGIGRPRVR